MGDAVYLLLIAAFFALAALYVKLCAAIIGPDEETLGTDAGPQRLAA
jgi:hypothetical protein